MSERDRVSYGCYARVRFLLCSWEVMTKTSIGHSRGLLTCWFVIDLWVACMCGSHLESAVDVLMDYCSAPVPAKPLKIKCVHLATEGEWPYAIRWVWYLIVRLVFNLVSSSKLILFFINILKILIIIILFVHILCWFCSDHFSSKYIRLISCNYSLIYCLHLRPHTQVNESSP